MADYALAFDGQQNYVSLGTMGNFGSNLGNGFYCSFQIKTTNTGNGAMFGFYTDNTNAAKVRCFVNNNGINTMQIWIQDNAGNSLRGHATINFTDGGMHIIVITANTVSNTITISIDGTPASITYDTNQALGSFSNFSNHFCLGAYGYNSGIGQFFACTLDNFQIGTSSSVLYGSYSFNEGSGTTTADSSGNSNTGTLTGSPLPTWVTGLNAYGNVTGNFTFNGNLSLTGNL